MSVLKSPPDSVGRPHSVERAERAKALPCIECPVKAQNVCQPLDEKRQRELYDTGKQQTWDRGQILFRAVDPAGPIFKIVSGIVAVSKRLPDGRRQILDFFFAGEICGYLERDGHYSFEGEAMTRVKTCSFNRAKFNAFATAHDDVSEVVRSTLAWKLESVSRHMAVLGQLTASERVATFLCRLSSHCEKQDVPIRKLALPMTGAEIADYLGIRLETVSRSLSELKQRKIIDLGEDIVVVLDPARLAELSGPDLLR